MKKIFNYLMSLIMLISSCLFLVGCGTKNYTLTFSSELSSGIQFKCDGETINSINYQNNYAGGVFEIDVTNFVDMSEAKLYVNGKEVQITKNDSYEETSIISAVSQTYGSFNIGSTSGNVDVKLKGAKLLVSETDLARLETLTIYGNVVLSEQAKLDIYYFNGNTYYLKYGVPRIEFDLIPQNVKENVSLLLEIGDRVKNISNVVFQEIMPAYQNGKRFYQISEDDVSITINLKMKGSSSNPETVSSLSEIESLTLTYSISSSTTIKLSQYE